ncbi:MAG: glycosyltransferase family 4 protein [Planctomycetes bacterium]|nr:glycosyltransferase family 4 protein [Planctomycetota bacterium]
MKVAIVNESVDPVRGGAETSANEMAVRLAEWGAEVTLVAADAPPGPVQEKVRSVVLSRRGATRAGRTCAFLQSVEQHCRDVRYDIVHAVMPCLSCDLYQPRGGTFAATIAHNLARAPNAAARLVRRVAGPLNFKQQYLRRVERDLLLRSNPPFVAAVSNLVAQQVRDHVPDFPADRLRVIFNACGAAEQDPPTDSERMEARRKLAVAPDCALLLFVAHNFRLKGLPELLESLRGIGLDSWTLLIAGRGDSSPYLKAAARLIISDRVRFLGSVPAVRPLLAAADLLVHPTWYDPCSRVVLEALCAGVPVVTTRLNGACEAIPAGAGIVIESPADTAALSAAIQSALKPAVRAASAEHVPAQRAALSMRRHAEDLLRFYQLVCSARSTSR